MDVEVIIDDVRIASKEVLAIFAVPVAVTILDEWEIVECQPAEEAGMGNLLITLILISGFWTVVGHVLLLFACEVSENDLLQQRI